MKKILIILALFILFLINYKESDIIIPNEAIRFRIIANSNSLQDQIIKSDLEYNLEKYIYEITKGSKSAKEVNERLLANVDNFNNYINNYMTENKIDRSFNVSIGKNYFPTKNYRNVQYEAGYYDSIVVTLGQGQGLNWWCVIYPPLCLIDKKDNTDIEYTSLVKELLDTHQL